MAVAVCVVVRRDRYCTSVALDARSFAAFEGFMEVLIRHADHGDSLLTGYPGTRPEKPGGF